MWVAWWDIIQDAPLFVAGDLGRTVLRVLQRPPVGLPFTAFFPALLAGLWRLHCPPGQGALNARFLAWQRRTWVVVGLGAIFTLVSVPVMSGARIGEVGSRAPGLGDSPGLGTAGQAPGRRLT